MHWFKSQLNPPTKIYQMYTKLLIHAKTKIYIAYQGKYINFFKADIGHMRRTGGPRAKCGLPHLFMWPTKQI